MLTWEQLESECRSCTKCQLHTTRNNIVLGVGNRDAEVMFVGEGPGENEDLKGEPFVGRAGKLLDDMLKIIGLSRNENIYIANIVKCRPPNNRDPQPAEREACFDWLRTQFALINPKIVVCLGRVPSVELIDKDLKITRDHGGWYEIDGINYFPIFHPAALLRDPRKKPETFVDLKELERMIKEICVRTL